MTKDQLTEYEYRNHLGHLKYVPQTRYPLQFKSAGHAALRAYVFNRDQFTCLRCGGHPEQPPGLTYSGRETVLWDDENGNHSLHLDHIKPLRAGGTHHPSNLHTLCDNCCAQKGPFMPGYFRGSMTA